MSALKHEIRQKQAQFNALETMLLRGPRPLPPSPPPTEIHLPATSTSGSSKMPRRSSWEQLSTLTAGGPESYIPLPLPNGRPGVAVKQEEVIKEGVPLDFAAPSLASLSSSLSTRRTESPTRSMSRTYHFSLFAVYKYDR